MGACLSAVDDAINDFIDKESRYYKESNNAKAFAEKEKGTHQNGSNAAILSSALTPLYPSLPKEAKQFHCKRVYDGDTLTLANNDRVRLLGIDTPELKEKQAFSIEAKEYTKRYCHGRDIWLSFDDRGNDGNKKDHYGRILAFVWVPASDDQFLNINEGLVAVGLAYAYTPSKSKKAHNYDKLLALQKMAREHKKGQWKRFKDYTVIITPNGVAFHKCKRKGKAESDCKHLARSKNLIMIKASDAYDRGCHPCRNCLG